MLECYSVKVSKCQVGTVLERQMSGQILGTDLDAELAEGLNGQALGGDRRVGADCREGVLGGAG